MPSWDDYNKEREEGEDGEDYTPPDSVSEPPSSVRRTQKPSEKKTPKNGVSRKRAGNAETEDSSSEESTQDIRRVQKEEDCDEKSKLKGNDEVDGFQRKSETVLPPLDVESLAEEITSQLKSPVDELVTSAMEIHQRIPDMVKRGLNRVLTDVQLNLQQVIEQRVSVLIASYVKTLNEQQSKLGTHILRYIIVASILIVSLVFGVSWYAFPSWEDIHKQRTLLDSIRATLAKTPIEVEYMGKMYVRVLPGTEIRLKGSDGEYTYAIIDPKRK